VSLLFPDHPFARDLVCPSSWEASPQIPCGSFCSGPRGPLGPSSGLFPRGQPPPDPPWLTRSSLRMVHSRSFAFVWLFFPGSHFSQQWDPGHKNARFLSAYCGNYIYPFFKLASFEGTLIVNSLCQMSFWQHINTCYRPSSMLFIYMWHGHLINASDADVDHTCFKITVLRVPSKFEAGTVFSKSINLAKILLFFFFFFPPLTRGAMVFSMLLPNGWNWWDVNLGSRANRGKSAN